MFPWRLFAAGVTLTAIVLTESGGAARAQNPPPPKEDGREAPARGTGFAPEPLRLPATEWRAWSASHALPSSAGSGDLAEWREVGPSNIAGRVNAVAFLDPAKPLSFVAGTAGGGILSTDDLGETWTRLGGDDLPSLWIGAIAVDPKNPEVFYAGTGDGNITPAGTGGAGGILKTIDGGQTFRLLPLPDSGAFYRILVSASDSSVVLAAANDGLYRSGDSGETWEKTGGSITPMDFVQDPKNPQRFLATSGTIRSGNGGLFESLDEGRSWHPVGTGLPDAAAWGRSALAMVDLPVRSLFLWIDKTSGTGRAQLYRSLSDASVWEPVAQTGVDARHGNGGWGGALRALGTATGQTLLHQDGFRMYAAHDAGPISETTAWTMPSGQWHSDTHGIDVLPGNPNLWAAATDGGVAVSTDGAATFYRVDQGFPTVQFYSCALIPGDATTILGGTQDNWMNVYRGDPGGSFELSFPPKLGDVGGISVNPAHPSEAVVATSHALSLAVSTDSGRTWQDTTDNGIPPQDFVTALRTAVVRSTVDPNRVYVGTHRLTISADGGRHWTQNEVRSDSNGGIASLAISPRDAEIWSLWSDGKVFLSVDGGATWANRSPLSVKTSPTVVAAVSGVGYAAFALGSGPRLFRTRDRGLSWTDISADLPNGAVHALLPDPRVYGRLLAGGDHGTMISDDEGDHWRPLGVGLPNTIVMDLCADPATRQLVAATHGRGMWRTTLPPLPERHVIGIAPPVPSTFDGR